STNDRLACPHVAVDPTIRAFGYQFPQPLGEFLPVGLGLRLDRDKDNLLWDTHRLDFITTSVPQNPATRMSWLTPQRLPFSTVSHGRLRERWLVRQLVRKSPRPGYSESSSRSAWPTSRRVRRPSFNPQIPPTRLFFQAFSPLP